MNDGTMGVYSTSSYRVSRTLLVLGKNIPPIRVKWSRKSIHQHKCQVSKPGHLSSFIIKPQIPNTDRRTARVIEHLSSTHRQTSRTNKKAPAAHLHSISQPYEPEAARAVWIRSVTFHYLGGIGVFHGSRDE
jgi:hypothetical protein